MRNLDELWAHPAPIMAAEAPALEMTSGPGERRFHTEPLTLLGHRAQLVGHMRAWCAGASRPRPERIWRDAEARAELDGRNIVPGEAGPIGSKALSRIEGTEYNIRAANLA